MTAEKEAALDSAAYQATAMRSKLEIQGTASADALAQSQAWYQEQVTAINTKYA